MGQESEFKKLLAERYKGGVVLGEDTETNELIARRIAQVEVSGGVISFDFVAAASQPRGSTTWTTLGSEHAYMWYPVPFAEISVNPESGVANISLHFSVTVYPSDALPAGMPEFVPFTKAVN